jgi:hypothetical protein
MIDVISGVDNILLTPPAGPAYYLAYFFLARFRVLNPKLRSRIGLGRPPRKVAA